MELPLDVQEAFAALAVPGESIECAAAAGPHWVLLSPLALYISAERIQRFPRGWVTGIECDRTPEGAMLFVGRDGILASVQFKATQRSALAAVEERLATGLSAPPAPVVASSPKRRAKGITIVLDQHDFAPGEHLRGAVVVDWPSDAPVRGIRVGFVGAERTHISVSSGSGTRRHSRTYREERALAGEERTLLGREPVGFLRAISEGVRTLAGRLKHPILKRGRHEFAFDFALPRTALPSHHGPHADVTYEICAQVDVPLGFDLVTEGEITVLSARGTRIEESRGEHAFDARGILSGFKASGSAVVELHGAPLVAGAPLEGRVIAVNTSRKQLKRASFSLRSIEFARARNHERTSETELLGGTLRVPDPRATEIDAVFGLVLPASAAAFSGRYCEVSLALDVTLEFAWSFDVSARLNLTTAR